MPVDITHATHASRAHAVRFYERDGELVDAVGAYVAGALGRDEVAVVVATEAHRLAFEQHLTAGGVDVAGARRAGRLVELDAAATMARFLVGGSPDPDRFDAVVGGLVRAAAASERPVRVFGEMVALLWEAGAVSAAIEVEALWNDLGTRVPFSLLCAYRSTSVDGDDHADALHEVCRLHSAVVDREWATTERSFPLTNEGPRLARRFVVETLTHWGCEHVVDEAALLASELATNAVLHAASDFTVVVGIRAATVRVSVRDRSPARPVERVAGPGGSTGRGLELVAALAAAWGAEAVPGGKVVWAELPA